MTAPDNPFDRFEIDPLLGPRGITERFRELIETAPAAERATLRAAWEELTLHPARRLRAALLAHPETRPPLGSPSAMPRGDVSVDRSLTVADLAFVPSVALVLGGDSPPRDRVSRGPNLEDDPILTRAADVR